MTLQQTRRENSPKLARLPACVARALAFINGNISIMMEDLASSSYGNITEVEEWNRFVISDFEP